MASKKQHAAIDFQGAAKITIAGAAGTDGQVLTSGGSGAMTWENAGSGGGSGTVTDDDATATTHEVAVYTGTAEVGLAQKLGGNNTGESLTIGATSDQTASGFKLHVTAGIECTKIQGADYGGFTLSDNAYTPHLMLTGGGSYAPTAVAGKGAYYAWGSTPTPRWINAAGTTYDISIYTTSDYRLKKNVEIWDTGTASTLVKSLPVYSYNWNDEGAKQFPEQAETNRVGFIAHEVGEKIDFNSLIAEEKDKVLDDGTVIPQGIKQPDMIPILWAALQDALKRIEVLEGQ